MKTLFFPPSQEEDVVDFAEESVGKECDAGDDPLTKAMMALMGKEKCVPSTTAISGETPKIEMSSRKRQTQSMAGLVELAKKVKKLGEERLLTLNDAKNLSDLKVRTVVVVLSAELKPAEHGSVALFTCVEVCSDGRREHLRLLLPSRFYVEKEEYPCIMTYLGKKSQNNQAS